MQAIPAAGVTKDADWIADTFDGVIKDVTHNKPSRLTGITLDNTKANRAALQQLEERHPQLIGLGCQAHGLSLLIKDLAKDKILIVGKTLDRSVVLINSVNACEKLRTLVQDKQVLVLGKVRTASREGCH
jgi:hypothetical protein